ncbi:uncharacterized protein [Miscanthus floridulus]|uniref:uncharacterized protein n=1 Tax=Miscanthus floridulus TaxID=154761 RepID=UPI00345A741C
MPPSQGFLSLGMRDMRSSPPPVPEDARRRAINWAHADAQKKWKDAKAAKRMKKILAREELDKRRRQQRKDGLPLEESPSPSLSTKASDGDDEGEVGRGPLDHLPDIVEVVPGVLASSPALPGGGGGVDPGSAIAHSRAEANTPEARALELGSEASRAAEASRVEAQCLKEKAEASQAEALHWKEKAKACEVETQRWEQKAKESEAEVTRAAEASSAVQTVLETEIEEHEALKSAAHATYEALVVKGV